MKASLLKSWSAGGTLLWAMSACASGGGTGDAPQLTAGAGGTTGSAGTSSLAGSSGAAGNAAAGTGADTGSGGAAGSAGTGGDAGASGSGSGGAAGAGGDGGTGGTGPVTDFREPCQDDHECDGGVCIEGPDGAEVCSKPCTETCPDGWRCAEIPGAADPEGYCVPRFSRLCRPCVADSDCRIPNVASESSRCLPRDNEGSFCGATCSDTEGCADGYFCDVVDVDGTPIKQCVRNGGQICGCDASWSGKGYATGCAVENGFGKCAGSRDCDTGTLSECSAKTPAAEVCDGEDNDCNAVVDDGDLCNDGLPCTTDVCYGDQLCSNELQEGACKIGFDCYADTEVNPLNACESCISANKPTEWTAQGASCNIGNTCYDILDASPTHSCLICNPFESTTAWTISFTKCLIGGSCYSDGDRDPNNSCSTCDPSRSLDSWSSSTASCDDDNECTGSDQCQANQTCSGTLREDRAEPSDSAGQALWLGQVDECDEDGQKVSASGMILTGNADDDWYKAEGVDDPGLCEEDPGLSVQTGGVSVRACIFVRCRNHDTDLNVDLFCQGGSTAAPDRPLSGYAGCCKTGGNVSFNTRIDCDGTDDDSTFYVRVDTLTASRQCVEYDIDIHF